MDISWAMINPCRMRRAVWALTLWILVGLSKSTGSDDYCHNDMFTATCAEGEAIVMTEALYGRMALGRCVKTDFGFVGCYVDVIEHVHSLCSGRRTCEVGVPDAELDKNKPCNEDLKSYLQATYECVEVSKPANRCAEATSFKLNGDAGYISSEVGMQTRCGSTSSPWVVEARAGQRVNLTLLDFSHTIGRGGDYSAGAAGSREAESLSVCQEYATLNETAFRKTSSICGGSGIGTRHVYTSLGNMLKIALSDQLSDQQHFLLRYEVVGCPDLEKPERGWVKRDYDRIEMGCVASDVTWALTCEGTEWAGAQGNCSTESAGAQKRGGGFSLSMGMSVFIILGVSAVVGLIVLAIGLVYLRRRRRRRHMGPNIPMKDIRPLREDIHYEASMYARNNAFEPVKVHVPKKRPDSADDADDNEYEYVWDISPGMLHSPDVCSRTCGRRAGGGGGDKCLRSGGAGKECGAHSSMTLPAHRHCAGDHGGKPPSRLHKSFAQTLTLPHNKKNTVSLVDAGKPHHRAGGGGGGVGGAAQTLDRCHCAETRPRAAKNHHVGSDKHCREECHVPQSCSFSSQDGGDKRYISKPVATTKHRPCSHCRSTHHEHRHCCHQSANT